MAVTDITMIGPPASSHNAVSATGHMLHPDAKEGGAEIALHFHTALVPKVVMAFNHDQTDDGFWVETMADNSHFNWASGAYDGATGIAPYQGQVPLASLYIREGVAVASMASMADGVIGWTMDGETLGSDEENVDYVCCGVQAQQEWDDGADGAPQGDRILFNFNQAMIEAPPDTKENDHALLKIGDTFHLIGITASPAALQGSEYFSHYTSPDLRTWTRGADLELGTGIVDNWRYQVWAPYIMANPGYGGGGALAAYKWLMFFTGAIQGGPARQYQKIGLAGCIDDTLNAWTILNSDAPIYWTGMDDRPNGGAYAGGAPWTTYGTDWCCDSRDPHVFTDGSDYYLIVFNTSSDPPGTVYKNAGLAKFNGGMDPDFTALTHCANPLWVSATDGNSFGESSHILVKDGLYHFWAKKNSGMRHQSDDDFMGPPWSTSVNVGTLFLRSTCGPGNATSSEVCQVDGEAYAISGHVQTTPYWYKINEIDFSAVTDPGHTPAETSGQRIVGLRGLVSGVLDNDLRWEIGDSEGALGAFYLQPVWGDEADACGYGASGMEGNSYIATHFRHTYPTDALSGSEWGDYTRVGWIKSSVFKVACNRIEVKMAGGDNIDESFVALVRADNDRVLFRSTGTGDHVLASRVWNTASLRGVNVYLVVVDQGVGDMDCIDVDYVREYEKASADPVPPVWPLSYGPLITDLITI